MFRVLVTVPCFSSFSLVLVWLFSIFDSDFIQFRVLVKTFECAGVHTR